MDSARGFDDQLGIDTADQDNAVSDVDLSVGGDERRMHVRAYNHWVSLLRGRAYPSIEDLDPASIADFGTHSVLLDFSAGIEDPKIQFLGKSLREECGIDYGITRVAEVPSRSLLSRLTDHYLQIIANRAPIGFEAEFVGTRGYNTMYRGILMPFSSDEDTIDFIYGVINWKELVDAETQARLNAEVAAARRATPVTSAAPWADGPGSLFSDDDGDDEQPVLDADATLADRLLHARESAATVLHSETRSRAALYRALTSAYAFACATSDDAEGYAELLEDAGIKPQARAPMTPVVKLVFGAGYDKTRVTEFAAVLTHADRNDISPADFASFLEGFAGGIKGIVAAERALRRPAAKPDKWEQVAAELRSRAPLAHVALANIDSEFVVLLARKSADGFDIVAVDADQASAERAIRRAAA
jgi:hypothetical protein